MYYNYVTKSGANWSGIPQNVWESHLKPRRGAPQYAGWARCGGKWRIAPAICASNVGKGAENEGNDPYHGYGYA